MLKRRPLSQETKDKISHARRGIRFTEEHRRKLSEAKLGKVPRNIKDGSLAEFNRHRTYASFSETWKKNLSTAHKGRHPKTEFTKGAIPWNLGLRFPERSGVNSPSWRGGLTEHSKQVRNSADYRAWRKTVFERDHYSCTACGNKKGGNLQADHIKPFSLYPALRLDPKNGRTLCVPCHKQTDTYGSKVLKYIMEAV